MATQSPALDPQPTSSGARSCPADGADGAGAAAGGPGLHSKRGRAHHCHWRSAPCSGRRSEPSAAPAAQRNAVAVGGAVPPGTGDRPRFARRWNLGIYRHLRERKGNSNSISNKVSIHLQ